MEAVDPDTVEQDVVVLAQRHDMLDEAWHTRRRIRLIHASDGVLTVHTESGRWVVPPQHAMWVLPGVLHRLCSTAPLRLHTLYAEPQALQAPGQCGVVVFDRLAEELLVAAAGLAGHYPPDGREARLVRVLLDRLPELAAAPLGLKYPRDPRVQQIAGTLSANPAEAGILDELAQAAGVTGRTAARLFVRETGLTFGQWRQQLRLLAALERLAGGASVTQVALEVGYNDVSSFIAVFKDAFGETPARYFR